MLEILMMVFLLGDGCCPGVANGALGSVAAAPVLTEASPRWGDGALDSGAGRIFLPGVNQVRVLGLDGASLGAVADLPGAQGVGVAPELGIGFACNRRASTVAIFNLATLEVEKRLRTTGAGPVAVLFEPATRRLFAFNEGGRNATAFDAFGGSVAGSIPLGGRPGPAVADGGGQLFVSLGELGEIAVLDARRLTVVHRFLLPGMEAPVALALDPGRHRLFVAGGAGALTILDCQNGGVEARLSLGGPVAGLACDAGTGLLFAASGAGGLRVVAADREGHFSAINSFATSSGVQGMFMDARTHGLYLPASGTGKHSFKLKAVPGVVPISIVGDDGGPGDGKRSALAE